MTAAHVAAPVTAGPAAAPPADDGLGRAGSLGSEAGSADGDKLAELRVKIGSATTFVIMTLIAAVLFVGIYAFMQFHGKVTADFSKHFIVMVVIVASMLLLLMGYSEQQIAPAFGLLGTILGYVFGRSQAEATPPPGAPAPPATPTPLATPGAPVRPGATPTI